MSERDGSGFWATEPGLRWRFTETPYKGAIHACSEIAGHLVFICLVAGHAVMNGSSGMGVKAKADPDFAWKTFDNLLLYRSTNLQKSDRSETTQLAPIKGIMIDEVGQPEFSIGPASHHRALMRVSVPIHFCRTIQAE